MKIRHHVERPLGSEFPAICNHFLPLESIHSFPLGCAFLTAYTTQTRCCRKWQTSPPPPVPPSGELDKTFHYVVFPKRCVCQLFWVGTSKSSFNFEYNLVSLSLSSAMSVFWISSLLMMSNNTPYGKRHGKRHGMSYKHLSSWKASRKATRNGLYTLSVLEKRLRK